jgi:hypothetical protein
MDLVPWCIYASGAKGRGLFVLGDYVTAKVLGTYWILQHIRNI